MSTLIILLLLEKELAVTRKLLLNYMSAEAPSGKNIVRLKYCVIYLDNTYVYTYPLLTLYPHDSINYTYQFLFESQT